MDTKITIRLADEDQWLGQAQFVLWFIPGEDDRKGESSRQALLLYNRLLKMRWRRGEQVLYLVRHKDITGIAFPNRRSAEYAERLWHTR